MARTAAETVGACTLVIPISLAVIVGADIEVEMLPFIPADDFVSTGPAVMDTFNTNLGTAKPASRNHGMGLEQFNRTVALISGDHADMPLRGYIVDDSKAISLQNACTHRPLSTAPNETDPDGNVMECKQAAAASVGAVRFRYKTVRPDSPRDRGIDKIAVQLHFDRILTLHQANG
jgi:hypothetical protein